MPSVVVRTSFKIFRALLDVRPRMRRLSQVLQIECKTWSVNMHRQLEEFFEPNGCKIKVMFRRNRRDNHLASETVSQLGNNEQEA